MAAGPYTDQSMDRQSMGPVDTVPALYDGTSSESSASSPLNYNGFDGIYGGNNFMTYPGYPMQYTTDGITPVGLIPVELEIEGLYEDYDRRRRKNGNEKIVSSHVHSRRRAQNRASQRAFRDRKEKHMKELEERLSELENRHANLSQSYESLQLEYSSVKQELDRMKNNRQEANSSRNFRSNSTEEQSEILDPLLFDVSAFCFDQDDGHNRTE